MSALITFGSTANAVETYTEKTKTTNVRLLTAKEFKDSKGLKGTAGKNAYNAYLREHGKANTSALAAALTGGNLLVKGYQSTENGLRVSFAFASKLKDKGTAETTADLLTKVQSLSAADKLAFIAQLKAEADKAVDAALVENAIEV